MAKTLTLAQRAKKDPKLLARVLKNPGLRSKLPTSMLPADMRNRRALNQRLKQPITDGSSITERDLARESKSAMDVKYGPVEQAQGQRVQEEQQRQRDFTGPGGFYDQYLHQMAENSKQVQNIGAATVGAGLAAQRGVAGLAGADFTQLQGQANQSAALNGGRRRTPTATSSRPARRRRRTRRPPTPRPTPTSRLGLMPPPTSTASRTASGPQ
jgi:hypothetical protein